MKGLFTIMCEEKDIDRTAKVLRKKRTNGEIQCIERTKVHEVEGYRVMYFVIECERSVFNDVVQEINGVQTWG